MKKSHKDIIEIAGAFVVAFLFYQFLVAASGTPLPIVSVVSESMYHRQGFDKWWDASGKFYSDLGLEKREFLEYQNFNGLSVGDLLVVTRPADLGVGDIVIYQRDSTSVTI